MGCDLTTPQKAGMRAFWQTHIFGQGGRLERSWAARIVRTLTHLTGA
jgi:hypothetical protein